MKLKMIKGRAGDDGKWLLTPAVGLDPWRELVVIWGKWWIGIRLVEATNDKS